MGNDKTALFSQKLNKLIERNNIKKIDLAKELGVSKSAVSNYLSGVSVPKIDMIIKIAAFFGVSFEELINTNTESESFSLNENDKYVCSIPLFQKHLSSENIIYKPDNFIGNITAPVFVPDNSDYYAVMVHDDLMVECGIVNGSIVIFDAESKPESGELAAVFIRNKKHIVIRRLVYENDKIKLCCKEFIDEYKLSKKESEITVLGKVSFATFDPNNAK